MPKSPVTPAKSARIEFDGNCEATGPKGAWCFLAAPFDVLRTFGTRARVPVRGAINGFAFRSSFTPMNGKHLLCINKEMQRGAGVKPGDTAHFIIERDAAPRSVEIPPVMKQALAANPGARAIFDKLSYTHKQEYVEWITSAKKDETRAARIAKLVPMLLEKQRKKR
jgi:Bacteriocin-protection, YdeI or OmpD-Associated/Domain of unknown function (DUF1905)